MPTPLPASIKKRPIKKSSRSEPLWKGPTIDGVTQGLVSRYLSCKERFRLLTIEGLKTFERFSAPLEFGNMWHVCERAHAANLPHERYLVEYLQELCLKFPFERSNVQSWGEKCLALFPIYVEHWAKHPNVVDRTPIFQEQPFDVPYELPSGRMVRLRGKWDGVDLIGKGKKAGVWEWEIKTKSSIDVQKLQQQLTFDLQTMTYVVALQGAQTRSLERPLATSPILGVRYNVVRRAAHKTVESMLKKLEDDREDKRIGEWFERFNVTLLPGDVPRFKKECLDPVLENLLDDYEWWEDCKLNGSTDGYDEWSWMVRQESFPHHQSRHFRFPYGVYNPVLEGGFGDLDEYMATGSEVGLERVNNLFPELTNA